MAEHITSKINRTRVDSKKIEARQHRHKRWCRQSWGLDRVYPSLRRQRELVCRRAPDFYDHDDNETLVSRHEQDGGDDAVHAI